MLRKKNTTKKVIWWESEPVVAGAQEARFRGDGTNVVRLPTASPYYGPVTVPWDDDGDFAEDTFGLASS